MSATTEKSSGTTAVRPFTIPVTTEAELETLRARVTATRWPDQELVKDHSGGPKLAVMQELARYWAMEYDWRRCEAKLNALPHFMTEIDGLDIHFIHVRSEHDNALPVIITHGWPGSIIELLAVIDPLTNPTAHGASAADAFDVVIPSMPGYGYSGKPRETGWGPDRIARAWTELMRRLGYTRFVAQGGDWGAIVTDVMATQGPPPGTARYAHQHGRRCPGRCLHSARAERPAGGTPPSGLSADESRTYGHVLFLHQGHRLRDRNDYAAADALRDRGLTRRPGRLDAQPRRGHAHRHRRRLRGAPGRQPDPGRVLGQRRNVYKLTNTGISSARLYWENTFDFFGVKNVAIPAAVTVFPKEIYKAPRSWAEKAYPNLIYFNEVDRGCHFAAWQEPAVLHRGPRRVPVTALASHGRVARTPCPAPAPAGNPRTPGPDIQPLGGIVMTAHWPVPAGLHTASARLPVEGEVGVGRPQARSCQTGP